MYTKEQIKIALNEFERWGSAQATITFLGYPSFSTLYRNINPSLVALKKLY